jgi:hypothetical protein
METNTRRTDIDAGTRKRGVGTGGFTLIEVIIASAAMAVMLIGICEILQLCIRRWDIQTSYNISVSGVDTALQRIQSDARFATSFTTTTVGANTLYVFTLPANKDAAGNYIPQRVSGALEYVAGPQVCFYLSDITGAQDAANGTILWRATAPAGSSVFTADTSWSLANSTVGRCPNVQSFSITTAGMPANSAQVSLTLEGASGFQTHTYSIVRQLNMGSVPLVVTPPSGLSAVAGPTSIALTWSAVPGANAYNLYRGTSSGGESAIAYASNLATPSYTDTFVAPGTTYYYEATSVFSTESGMSSEASAAMAAGYVTAAPTTPGGSEWYGEEDINVTASQPITALTATITTAQTSGWSIDGASNTFTGGFIAQSQSSSGGNETYTFVLNAGDTQPAGGYKLAAQYNLAGTSHPTLTDTYTLTVTSGGITQTLNGHF